MTFLTNGFFPEILSARGATAIDENINFGRDKLIAWSSSPSRIEMEQTKLNK